MPPGESEALGESVPHLVIEEMLAIEVLEGAMLNKTVGMSVDERLELQVMDAEAATEALGLSALKPLLLLLLLLVLVPVIAGKAVTVSDPESVLTVGEFELMGV